jgi:hypothetical protein
MFVQQSLTPTLGKDMRQVEHRLSVPLKSPPSHIPETFQEYVDFLPLGEQDLFFSTGNVVRVLYYPGSHRPISGGGRLW